MALFALGVAIEILQSFVPSRQSSVLDAFANSIGVLIGLGLAAVINRAIDAYIDDSP